LSVNICDIWTLFGLGQRKTITHVFQTLFAEQHSSVAVRRDARVTPRIVQLISVATREESDELGGPNDASLTVSLLSACVSVSEEHWDSFLEYIDAVVVEFVRFTATV